MSERFVNVDRETPMLPPADLRQWVPEDEMVHFVLAAIEAMPGGTFRVNRRGSGSPQYPPQMMTALLVYCYSQGVFSARRIERATWHNVAVRYLTGDTHPDHDTICAFRRNNGDVIKAMFAHVVNLAREMGVVKVSTVSVDGTHIKANASTHKSVRYDRAGELEAKLGEDIDRLLAEAEAADGGEQEDGNRLPEEIGPREVLQQKMQEAQRRLEQRAQQEAEEKRKKNKGEDDPPSDEEGGGGPVEPRAEQQINLTDPDSALMRKSRRHGWEEAYNAQLVVDAGVRSSFWPNTFFALGVMRGNWSGRGKRPHTEHSNPQGCLPMPATQAAMHSRTWRIRSICMWQSVPPTTESASMTSGRRSRSLRRRSPTRG